MSEPSPAQKANCLHLLFIYFYTTACDSLACWPLVFQHLSNNYSTSLTHGCWACTADTGTRVLLGFLLNRKVSREDECKSNYSDFKLLGFDKHLLMQVLATELFIAVFSTSRNVIALQHKARMIHMPCSPRFHTALCIQCAQKHPVMMVPPSPLLRLHSPKKLVACFTPH